MDLHTLDRMRRRLEKGYPVADATFDEVYPAIERARSSAFWTPVAVGLRAAEMLVPSKIGRVLDVGSGAGKFCIVGAASTRALFVGMEQREHLVDAAKDAARRIGTSNAVFFHGTFDTADITTYDAVYFFNPFEENLWPKEAHLDHTVELSASRFEHEVERVHDWLGRARSGTRVVTYHGLGVPMPPCYERVSRIPIHTGALELWIKMEMLARCG